MSCLREGGLAAPCRAVCSSHILAALCNRAVFCSCHPLCGCHQASICAPDARGKRSTLAKATAHQRCLSLVSASSPSVSVAFCLTWRPVCLLPPVPAPFDALATSRVQRAGCLHAAARTAPARGLCGSADAARPSPLPLCRALCATPAPSHQLLPCASAVRAPPAPAPCSLLSTRSRSTVKQALRSRVCTREGGLGQGPGVE